MKTIKLALLAATATLAISSVAHAEDRPLGLTFNAGAATDYVFRGISQTNNKAEAFAGADITVAKIGYAGLWLSNVDFLNGTRLESDFYAGVKPTLGPVAFDFGVIYYGYNPKPSGPDEAYTEFKALASVPVGPATLGVAYYHSPEFPFKTGEANYYEINAAAPIPSTKFSVSAAIGKQEVVGPLDYTTWNAGVGYALTDKVGLDVRYWDTDQHSFGKIYEPKLVASIKATF
ncbi:MAG: hypothetical protein JWQ46_208 [Phenylobacterium sp.]|nr:hypothetical protein [Phenylobacterium sp.]